MYLPYYTFAQYPVKLNIDLRNEYNTLNTRGHNKAKGLNISMKYPKGFIMREGNRPNIVYLCKDSVHNMLLITLSVHDLEKNLPYETKNSFRFLDNEEKQNIVYEQLYQDFKNGGGGTKTHNLKRSYTYVEGLKTMLLTNTMFVERAGLESKSYNVTYNIYYDKKLIIVGCVFDSLPDHLINQANYFSTIIANHFVLHNLWE